MVRLRLRRPKSNGHEKEHDSIPLESPLEAELSDQLSGDRARGEAAAGNEQLSSEDGAQGLARDADVGRPISMEEAHKRATAIMEKAQLEARERALRVAETIREKARAQAEAIKQEALVRAEELFNTVPSEPDPDAGEGSMDLARAELEAEVIKQQANRRAREIIMQGIEDAKLQATIASAEVLAEAEARARRIKAEAERGIADLAVQTPQLEEVGFDILGPAEGAGEDESGSPTEVATVQAQEVVSEVMETLEMSEPSGALVVDLKIEKPVISGEPPRPPIEDESLEENEGISYEEIGFSDDHNNEGECEMQLEASVAETADTVMEVPQDTAPDQVMEEAEDPATDAVTEMAESPATGGDVVLDQLQAVIDEARRQIEDLSKKVVEASTMREEAQARVAGLREDAEKRVEAIIAGALDEAETRAEAEARRLMAETEAEAERIEQDAEVQVEDAATAMLARADSEAEEEGRRILEEAEAEAERLLREARERAAAVATEKRTEAQREGEAEAERLRSEAAKRAEQLKLEAEQRVKDTIEQAKANAESSVSDEVARIRDETQQEVRRIEEEAQKRIQELVAGLRRG